MAYEQDGTAAEKPIAAWDGASTEPQCKVNCDLHRLARFGLNIADAYSCFIFLPAELLAALTCTPLSASEEANQSLLMAGFHSLSNDVIEQCRLSRGSGLVGWVAKHGRSIHVSPFELDSRTLGIYSSDQQLKSFIGIPIALDQSREGRKIGSGVLACDSKKSFAFSKLQTKLLENLSAEISNTLELLRAYSSQGQVDIAWQTFIRRANDLQSALGAGSLEVLRVRIGNFGELESALGTPAALGLAEQASRLVQQALPPHFPIVRLTNGDLIVCLDNMMTSFYENKFRAIAEHLASGSRGPQFLFSRISSRDKRFRGAKIEELVSSTSIKSDVVPLTQEIKHEYRRA